jgi:hypothetical protein
MDALLFLVVVSLLIIVGVVSSVRLYTRGALGTGRFRRIRRLRYLRPLPDGTVIEEKVEEVIDEGVPAEETPSV